MCGIFGVASIDALPETRSLLESLSDRLQHRGPDARGSYCEENVFLGHRRLSVIDVNGGRQPMTACEGRYVVVYNGELYNFKELRRELETLGHRFRTDCDTEVVLKAYAAWGADCVLRFRGMFAFAIWDKVERELLLVRDRLGIKPLYYAEIGNRLIFASEMKAILAHPEFERRPDIAALSSYLTFRSAVGESTVFRGMRSLAPGHRLRFRNGRIEVGQYWDIPAAGAKVDRGEAFYLARLREMLPEIVGRHLVSDVPVGAYLSGGLDSSLMVALMAEQHAGPLHTYSIGFDEAGYDEGRYARAVSAHLGTRHRHLTFGARDFAAMMEDMVRHRDQPLSIPHEAALQALSKELKKDVTVCLSGEGADELFGGYGRVQRSPMDFKKLAIYGALPAPLRALIRSFVSDPDIARRLQLKDDVQHFFHVYNWWPLADKWAVLSGDVRSALDSDRALQQQVYALFARCGSADPYDRVFHFFEKYHLLNLLERLDVQSMAASVEARVPFVDHELVEFVMSIPVRHKMRWKSPLHMLRAVFMKSENASEHLDVSKYLLRRLADEKLPPEIAGRKKLGFPVPLNAWFGGALRDYAREILLDERARNRGFFDSRRVEKLLLEPQNIAYDFYGKRVWMLLNIELWFRAHIDGAAAGPPQPRSSAALALAQ